MKNRILSAMLLGTFAVASVYAEGTIGERKENQQARIARGVGSGRLTPRETARIERKEARLNHEIRHDRNTGGGMSAKEKARVDRQQDRLSKDIYQQKHDAQQVK